MADFFGNWIMSLTGAAILTASAIALTPKSQVRNVVRLVCGVVMTLTLIRPVLDIDIGTIISGFSTGGEYDITDAQNILTETNNLLSVRIIEEQCAAYILDKAQVMGNSALTVTVTAKCGDDGCYYPYEVDIRGPEYARDSITSLIETELGIPRERQNWSIEDEDPEF